MKSFSTKDYVRSEMLSANLLRRLTKCYN